MGVSKASELWNEPWSSFHVLSVCVAEAVEDGYLLFIQLRVENYAEYNSGKEHEPISGYECERGQKDKSS